MPSLPISDHKCRGTRNFYKDSRVLFSKAFDEGHGATKGYPYPQLRNPEKLNQFGERLCWKVPKQVLLPGDILVLRLRRYLYLRHLDYLPFIAHCGIGIDFKDLGEVLEFSDWLASICRCR